MTRLLRHISIRLWLLLCWALPLGFLLLSWFPKVPGGAGLAASLVVCGLLQGVLLDAIGIRRIRGLVREGKLWEQAGIRPRAETAYLKAVRVYDSILVSPLAAHRLSRFFTQALAGFYLSGPTQYPGFQQAAARYLIQHPDDETLALLWLARDIKNGDQQDAGSGAVLTALAEALYAHPKAAPGLAARFMRSGRTDVTAKRLYRSVLEMAETGVAVSGEIKEKLQVFLGASALEDLSDLGIAGDAVIKDEIIQKGGTLGDQIFVSERPGSGESRSFAGKRQWWRSAVCAAGSAALGLLNLISRSINLLGQWIRRINPEKAKVLSVRLLMAGMAVWLGFFLYGALTHILKTRGGDPITRPIQVRGPFTIQVAAYLKSSHADHYVQKLKALGLDAHIKQTAGGGKTWYLVRISHFKDQTEAAAFGKKLKAQKKIEDFFVSNT